MTRVRQWFGLTLVIGLTGAMWMGGCGTTPPEETPAPPEEAKPGPHDALLKLFPKSGAVAGWRAEGPVKVYGPSFNAADAVEPIQADLPTEYARFLGYGYRKSGTSRLVSEMGDTVTVRIFTMDSPSEAFGIFSVHAKGVPSTTPGLVARMGPTALGFVKGDCYVWLEYAGSAPGEAVLRELGTGVAGQITSTGYLPSILASFPRGAVQGEQYYLHAFDTWSSLPLVPAGDPGTVRRMLALGPGTDVTIVGYPTDMLGELNYLFAIRYGSRAEAEAAATAYSEYLDASQDPAEQNTAVAAKGQHVVGTFNAEENSVHDRLRELMAELLP